jgi:hypothetical protein
VICNCHYASHALAKRSVQLLHANSISPWPFLACRSYCVVRLTAEQNYRSKKPLLIQTVEKKTSLKQLCVQKQPFFGTATNLGPCVGGSESAASYCVCRFRHPMENCLSCLELQVLWGVLGKCHAMVIDNFCLKSRQNLLNTLETSSGILQVFEVNLENLSKL